MWNIKMFFSDYQPLITFISITNRQLAVLPYLTLPYLTFGVDRLYTCPALRPYQLGPMRIPECNQKVTGSGHKAVTAVKP